MAITKIATPELFDFSATNTALQLPTGTTAERPAAPVAGEWRFNTTLKYVEYYDGAAWFQIDTEVDAVFTPSENFNTSTYFGNGATQTVDAKFNEAANFNGSSSKIDLPNLGISGAATRTISAWINVKSLSAAQTIFQFGASAAGERFGFAIDSAGKLYVEYYGRDAITSSAQITTGSWFNVAVTYNGGAIETPTNTQIYVNGSPVAMSTTGTSTGAANTADSNYGIGYRRASTSQYFSNSSKIDQLRIFNTALPATGTASIATLYLETTTTAATLDFPVGAGCIAAYQLDGDASDISGTYGGVESNIGYTGLEFQPDLSIIKTRSNVDGNFVFDSIRGVRNAIQTNSTTDTFNRAALTAFDSNGFTLGNYAGTNSNNYTYVAWNWYAPTSETNNAGSNGATITSTIKKNVDAGFSIVEYEGSGATATVGHGLGSIVELLIVKGLETTNDWSVLSKDNANGNFLQLNGSSGQSGSGSIFGSPTARPTDSVFTIGNTGETGTNGKDYVAYCFISIPNYQKIGSYVGTNAPGNIISTELTVGDGGFEPALVMIKLTTANSGNWIVFDNKRNSVNPRTDVLKWDTSGDETTEAALDVTFATNGFVLNGAAGAPGTGQINSSGETYIYLAIAADKDTSVPTLANSFETVLYTGNGGTQNISTSFAPDLTWIKERSGTQWNSLYDSIRGVGNRIVSNSSNAQNNDPNRLTSFNPNGFSIGSDGDTNTLNDTYVSWNWKAGGLPSINTDGSITSIVSANQAAGFSVVKYVATGASTTGHGLGVLPRMIIQKKTSAPEDWYVYFPPGVIDSNYNYMVLNSLGSKATTSSTPPTTTTFNPVSSSGSYIAYCFADITGYQKIESYNGDNSTDRLINTGFAVRFVMIRKTNGTSNWQVFDTQRGGNAQLDWNGIDAEYTAGGTRVEFVSNGFKLKSNYTTYNATGGEYIYLAIA